jgi:hypothetical protein
MVSWQLCPLVRQRNSGSILGYNWSVHRLTRRARGNQLAIGLFNRAGARLTTAASLRRNPHHGIQPPQDGSAARRAESNLNDLLFETTPEARHALSMGRACVTTSSRHRVTTSHRDRVTTSHRHRQMSSASFPRSGIFDQGSVALRFRGTWIYPPLIRSSSTRSAKLQIFASKPLFGIGLFPGKALRGRRGFFGFLAEV